MRELFALSLLTLTTIPFEALAAQNAGMVQASGAMQAPQMAPATRTTNPKPAVRPSAASDRVMTTPEFVAAQRRGDAATMNKLLAGTGMVVSNPSPQLIPLCLPSPPKFTAWVYGNYNNVMMWHWTCLTMSQGTTTPPDMDTK
jgi:hypothetical protein